MLLYCYYGGMIKIGLKRYSEASDLLSQVLNVPAQALSAIMVACYKKLILTTLLAEGASRPSNRSWLFFFLKKKATTTTHNKPRQLFPPLPFPLQGLVFRFRNKSSAQASAADSRIHAMNTRISPRILSPIRPTLRPWKRASAQGPTSSKPTGISAWPSRLVQLASYKQESLDNHDAPLMSPPCHVAVQKGRKEKAYNPFDLHVSRCASPQVVAAVSRRNIKRLTSTYLTLALDELANVVNLPDARSAENSLVQLIEDGSIYGRISCAHAGSSGMVQFGEAPEEYAGVSAAQIIQVGFASLGVID